MEERTQIKFSNPDIEGNPIPQLITLDQETPIEGTGERENGEPFIYHKWLVTDNQYFMASDSLDGMLKLIPNKMGTILKIQKVDNPKGGFPFFQINGMNKDDIIAKVNASNIQTNVPVTVPQPILVTPPDTTGGAITRLEQKIDQVIQILSSVETVGRVADSLAPHRQPPVEEEELPF